MQPNEQQVMQEEIQNMCTLLSEILKQKECSSITDQAGMVVFSSNELRDLILPSQIQGKKQIVKVLQGLTENFRTIRINPTQIDIKRAFSEAERALPIISKVLKQIEQGQGQFLMGKYRDEKCRRYSADDIRRQDKINELEQIKKENTQLKKDVDTLRTECIQKDEIIQDMKKRCEKVLQEVTKGVFHTTMSFVWENLKKEKGGSSFKAQLDGRKQDLMEEIEEDYKNGTSNLK